MRTLKGCATVAALAIVLAACSSGGSDDGVTVDAKRPRGAAPGATADGHMDGGHMDGDHMDDGHMDGDHMDGDHMDDDEVVAPADAHTVEIEMTEFAYDPDEITVPAGEPIRFVFHNAGVIDHEAMVGDAHMQEEFEESGDHGEHAHHGDVDAVTVSPGETEELVVTFDEPGETMLGCHLDGHWAAGMAATVTITAG